MAFVQHAEVALVARHTFWDLDVEKLETPPRERCFSDGVLALAGLSQPDLGSEGASDEAEAIAGDNSGDVATDHSDAEVEDPMPLPVARRTFWDLDAGKFERPARERCYSDSVLAHSDISRPTLERKLSRASDEDDTTATGSSCDEATDHSDAEMENLTAGDHPRHVFMQQPVVWSFRQVPSFTVACTEPVLVSSRHEILESNLIKRESDGQTTLALKNLPVDLTRESLMSMLDSQGLEGLYNFVYLPLDFATGRALGYATLNMETSYVAELAMKLLKGFNAWNSERALDVRWNIPHQGADKLIAFYRNSRSMHGVVPEKYKPVLLQDGVRIEFPAPTRTIAEPVVSSL